MQSITDFHSTLAMIAIVVQVVIPLLVGLVTKMNEHPSALKSILMIVLTAANDFFTTWIATGNAFDWKTYLFNLIIGIVVSVATYYGVWKPTGTAKAFQTSFVKDTHTFAA